MRTDLPTLARRARNPRRRTITLRDIVPPATLATDLYLATYAKVVRLWTDATPRIIAAYERTLGELTTDSPGDVQREIDAADNGFLRLLLEIAPKLSQWALRTERWYRGKWRGAVLSATGVDLDTMLGPEDVRDTLDAYIRWNTDLIRDVSNQTRQRISGAVFAGLTARTPVREVAKQISEATGLARDRSKRIAADQLTKITGSLAEERRREAGIDEWEWVWSRKKHGRPEHIARDGKVYADTEAGADEARGVLPPPKDRPGQLPYCGCRSRAVLRFD